MVTLWTYNVVLTYVQSKEDAEEVVQDTLMAVLNGIGKFKNESSLKTWVYSIAINKSKDVLKYKSRRKRLGNVVSISQNEGTKRQSDDILPPNFEHPGIVLENKEQMQLLFKGINQLPEKQKEALILAKLDHMSMKEISVVMKTSPKAVESLLSRARTNFKAYLEKEDLHNFKKT
jgi:RNA polymerase sigma-70 factor (ECF subfamily)